MDRRPVKDKRFWETLNPYTKAPRIPLGTPREVSFDDPQLREQESPAAPALERLKTFSGKADQASFTLSKLRTGRGKLDAETRQRLRELGYID